VPIVAGLPDAVADRDRRHRESRRTMRCFHNPEGDRRERHDGGSARTHGDDSAATTTDGGQAFMYLAGDLTGAPKVRPSDVTLIELTSAHGPRAAA
jgi:hypothetical protein